MNFSFDEDRVLRECFAKHQEYLTSAHSNKMTNKIKREKWNEIAASVSAIGYCVRDVSSSGEMVVTLSGQNHYNARDVFCRFSHFMKNNDH